MCLREACRLRGQARSCDPGFVNREEGARADGSAHVDVAEHPPSENTNNTGIRLFPCRQNIKISSNVPLNIQTNTSKYKNK